MERSKSLGDVHYKLLEYGWFSELKRHQDCFCPRLAWSEISALLVHLKVPWRKSKRIGGQKARESELEP